jgi:hypothetical protein
MSKPPRRGLAFLANATVFTTTLGVANGINGEIMEHRMSSLFFRSRHIEPPRFQLADRSSHWDADN